MNAFDFLNYFPNLLKHPELKKFSKEKLFFDQSCWGLFRHELCHFLEREIEKAFLPNFGFAESFGQNLIKQDGYYFKAFVERELRVMTLEKVAPFSIGSSAHVNFSDSSFDRIFLNPKSYYDYKEKQYLFFDEAKWWNLFVERYRLLSVNEIVDSYDIMMV